MSFQQVLFARGTNRDKKRLLARGLTFCLCLALLFSSACAPMGEYSEEGNPIEPLVAGQEESSVEGDLVVRGRFAVVNPEMKVYALDISSDGRWILFSSDARTVNMIDDQGRLQWDVSFDENPTSAALSSDGRFAAVGTEKGEIHFFRQDGREQWNAEVEGSIKKMKMAPGGENLAVSVKKEDGQRRLCFYDSWGGLLYELETRELNQIVFLPPGNFGYIEKHEEKNMVVVYRDGEPYWEKEVSLAAFSGNGSYVATASGTELAFFNLEGGTQPREVWSQEMEIEPSWMHLTEMGGHVIAYSGFSGSSNNLFVFDRSGELTWDKRIPDGALVQASRFGERIVASSWQEYSEDFSELLVLDIKGNILQDVEMASRIEKMALSGDGKVLGLAGSDGDIFVFELPVLGSYHLETETVEEEGNGIFYRQVNREEPEDESYVTLFFYDQNAMHLVPVNRPVKKSSASLSTAVDELVKGPRRESNLSRTIPKDANIQVKREEGIAYIDLPEELNQMIGSAQAAGVINSLVYTVSQFSSVRGIQFLIEGEKDSYFGTEGLFIHDILPPQRPGLEQAVIYVPFRSGDRYYLLPRESLRLGDRTSRPADLVQAIIKESERFLPAVPELKEARVYSSEIVLDWDESFQELFPPGGDETDIATAELFMDSLLLTLAERFTPNRLVFKVEGERWTPPEGYPDLVQELTYPYFINPE